MRSSPRVFFFLLVFLFHSGQSDSKFPQHLHDLTNEIVTQFFGKFRCVTYVTDDASDVLKLANQQPVFLILVNDEKDWRTAMLIQSFEQACGGYVVRVKGKVRTSVVRKLLLAKNQAVGSRYNIQRYLFLPKHETDVDTDYLDDPQMFFMPNTVSALPASNDTFELVGHTVFNDYMHSVLGITREVLDIWKSESGFKTGGDLYPDKMKNLNGKKVIFAVLHYSPFSLVMNEGNETSFDGFETRIAAQFVKTMNGTWDALDHPVEMWGHALPNGSGTGIVGSVMSHRADIGYSAIYQWFCNETDCTYPLYQSRVTCLAPRPRLVSGWLTIVLPFAWETWTALVVIYVVNTGVVLFLLVSLKKITGFMKSKKAGMMLSDAFFIVFRLQLEQIPRIPKSRESLAVFVRICACYYFFVAAFWQGGIASILTVPRYEKPINTITDLLEKWPKIEWGANSDVWILSIKDSTEPKLMELVHKFVISDDDSLRRRASARDFSYFLERLPHGHYGYSGYINEETVKYLRLMESEFYLGNGVMILPKGSPYLEKLDQVLMKMFDTGLIHKQEVQVFMDRIDNRMQNLIKYSNEKEKSSVILAVRHIEGPLYIYLVGIVVASGAFVVENLSRLFFHVKAFWK